MGSKRSHTLYRLKFDDGEYEGLEITLRGLSIKKMRSVSGPAEETVGDVVERMAALIAQQIDSWNREDENGEPLPPTLESIEEEEPALIHLIVDKWTEAIAGVSDPLESDSSNGETSAVVDIPMEALSPSLAS